MNDPVIGSGLRSLLQQVNTTATVTDLAPHQGAFGKGWDIVFCLLPIAFLVLVTVIKPIHISTSISLPMAAGLMWIIRLSYLRLDTNFTNAVILYGLFDALTPLSIIAGAICLFQTMEQTQCLPWIMAKVRGLSAGHPVAEVFLIGWAFEYMIEGASGFGTPVALAAPMLVSLGHSPVESVICALIMNTLATVYGAVGTPIWFGLDGLGLSDSELMEVGWCAQVMLLAAAHIVPVLAASFLVRWADLVRSWRFILLSIWAAKVPALGLAFVSTEFSSLIGGMVAVVAVGALSASGFGLSKNPVPKAKAPGDDGIDSAYDADAATTKSNALFSAELPSQPEEGNVGRSVAAVPDPREPGVEAGVVKEGLPVISVFQRESGNGSWGGGKQPLHARPVAESSARRENELARVGNARSAAAAGRSQQWGIGRYSGMPGSVVWGGTHRSGRVSSGMPLAESWGGLAPSPGDEAMTDSLFDHPALPPRSASDGSTYELPHNSPSPPSDALPDSGQAFETAVDPSGIPASSQVRGVAANSYSRNDANNARLGSISFTFQGSSERVVRSRGPSSGDSPHTAQGQLGFDTNSSAGVLGTFEEIVNEEDIVDIGSAMEQQGKRTNVPKLKRQLSTVHSKAIDSSLTSDGTALKDASEHAQGPSRNARSSSHAPRSSSLLLVRHAMSMGSLDHTSLKVPLEEKSEHDIHSPVITALLRTMPLWLTVLLLLVTRIKPIGVRDYLKETDPSFTVSLGNLFDVSLSAAVVVTLENFLNEGGLTWKYEALYVPFIIPFILVSAITVVVFRSNLPPGFTMLSPFCAALRRAAAIVPALMGSLVLVALIRQGESQTSAPAYIIGYNLSDVMGKSFMAISGLLGALGTFFSGSTTVSNLTFGVVQQVAARGIDVSETTILALQSVGSTAGNMVCINNIISAQTVVGGLAAATSEGSFMMKTAPVMGLMLVIATCVALPFLLL